MRTKTPKVDRTPPLYRCVEHGDEMCYLQNDGTHCPINRCACKGSDYSPDCPIDYHRGKWARIETRRRQGNKARGGFGTIPGLRKAKCEK